VSTTGDLLSLRHRIPDLVLLDWADLAQLVDPPAVIRTRVLMEHWNVTQPQASRRLNALAAAGLADITPGWGAYQVHAVRRLEGAA